MAARIAARRWARPRNSMPGWSSAALRPTSWSIRARATGCRSAIIVLGLGILLGMIAAFRRGSRLDRAVVMVGVLGISSPSFVTGIFLLYLFGVVLGWFPTFGAGRGVLDRFWHLTLPSFALALSVMAITVKITRASMIEELDKDYVTFARARGLSVARITLAYVLRN